MRPGIAGLAALTHDVLRQKPASGAAFAFRGRRGDPLPVSACLHAREGIKLLYWDDQGFCLYYKVLERGRFPWPSAQDGAVRMTSAQRAMLRAPFGTSLRDPLPGSEGSAGGARIGDLRLRVWGDLRLYVR